MEKLDLHRTRHEDAGRKVIRFIEEHWGCDYQLEIVTGNSFSMKKIVLEILEEYKLEWSIGRVFDSVNCGYIVIYPD